MCHMGCMYEYKTGAATGVCRIRRNGNYPRGAMCRVNELVKENKSLREFISQIWHVVEHPATWCHSCQYEKECVGTMGNGTYRHKGCMWREDMRSRALELGIEAS